MPGLYVGQIGDCKAQNRLAIWSGCMDQGVICDMDEVDEIPGRRAYYEAMMAKRDHIDFDDPHSCKLCGREWGNHLTANARKDNPNACPFVKTVVEANLMKSEENVRYLKSRILHLNALLSHHVKIPDGKCRNDIAALEDRVNAIITALIRAESI